MIQSDVIQPQMAAFSSSSEPVPHNLAHYDINLAQREPQVLIIDDEPEVAEEVAESLGMKGFTCAIATFARLAKDLEAGYLLTESVQREADRVRVDVDLIDGSSGGTRWSERFDRRGEGVELK